MLLKQPAKVSNTAKLQAVVSNLELLYIKAKDFHWNTKGVYFRQHHKMYDEIQEVALDWADTFAERMRSLDMPVVATAKQYINDAWYPEAERAMVAEEMLKDMKLTLTCISKNVQELIADVGIDAVTQNKLQDLCADIDKQYYFVNSSMEVK
ncbi:ferritin-like domain-containing protein [Herbiconiux daphne]|uniref:Ferritin-like domain-containing protein n=1 Tax=Herbiconiux daphne TaxID=2970914 RepID=A0ABT2HAP0_9MICO|nr:ferritin-like domain-containing protein [Herbiconiux daphne]MCS5737009.1 ferritin-like domain-containing protein [Herbiconiux daphne]